MVMTASTMMELGTTAPDFTLPSTEGTPVSLSDFSEAKAVVVMFICNHCPYVIHIAPVLAQLAKSYAAKGVQFIAINSNDIAAYPADSMENMVQEKAKQGYEFPYLLDESQQVAKQYDAACTPDIYLFDSASKLAYRGQFDDSRPFRISSGNYDSERNPSTGADLSAAIDTVLAGDAIEGTQYPSLGCNIKWIPGNEPAYFAG